MSQVVEAGYYINGWSEGGVHGPRRSPGTCVHLVFGPPLKKAEYARDYFVEPLMAAFELLRYNPRDNLVFVTRHQLSTRNIIWGLDKKAIPVKAHPRLHAVFDDLLPEYKKAFTAYARGCCLVQEEAVRKLSKSGIVRPDPFDRDRDREFWKRVKDVATPISSPLVRVGGLGGILGSIPVTQYRKH